MMIKNFRIWVIAHKAKVLSGNLTQRMKHNIIKGSDYMGPDSRSNVLMSALWFRRNIH